MNGLTRQWNIYTMEYYSPIKKNKIMPSAATQMELETLILSAVSERERQIPYDITYLWNLTQAQMKLSTEKKIMDLETDLWSPREWDGLGVWG